MAALENYDLLDHLRDWARSDIPETWLGKFFITCCESDLVRSELSLLAIFGFCYSHVALAILERLTVGTMSKFVTAVLQALQVWEKGIPTEEEPLLHLWQAVMPLITDAAHKVQVLQLRDVLRSKVDNVLNSIRSSPPDERQQQLWRNCISAALKELGAVASEYLQGGCLATPPHELDEQAPTTAAVERAFGELKDLDTYARHLSLVVVNMISLWRKGSQEGSLQLSPEEEKTVRKLAKNWVAARAATDRVHEERRQNAEKKRAKKEARQAKKDAESKRISAIALIDSEEEIRRLRCSQLKDQIRAHCLLPVAAQAGVRPIIGKNTAKKKVLIEMVLSAAAARRAFKLTPPGESMENLERSESEGTLQPMRKRQRTIAIGEEDGASDNE